MIDEEEFHYDGAAMAALSDPHAITFLTGKAGTGKSTMVRHWLRTQAPPATLTVAPTGIAALNVGGETIHRFIHARPGSTPEQAYSRGLMFGRDDFYRSLDALVVDEVSMVRADLMDSLDMFLKGARGSKLPFGGLKLVLVGDLAQLPPVVTRDEREAFAGGLYDSPWFFSSEAMKPVLAGQKVGFRGIELDTVHRQADPAFVDALNGFRDGEPPIAALDSINAHVGRWDLHSKTIVLAATNRRAEAINRVMLEAIKADETVYAARKDGRWNPSLTPAPERLRVRDGMRLMLLANDPAGLYANGSMGTLVGHTPGTLEVRLDDGSVVGVGRHTWQVMQTRMVKGGDGGKRLDSRPLGSYTQMPVAPAWAVTIHKSQGKSFDSLYLELPDGPLFAAGQAYVALSRARSLEGLSLSRPLAAADVIADPDQLAFMDRARAGFPQPDVQEALFA